MTGSGNVFGTPTDIAARPSIAATSALGISVFGAVLFSLEGAPAEVRGLGGVLLFLPAATILLVEPTWVFVCLLVSAGALNVAMSRIPFEAGARLYPVDFLLLVAALAAVIEWRRRFEQPRLMSRGSIFLIICFAGFGVLQTARGLLGGNALDDALGTLRRMFVYPLAAFLIARVFVRERSGMERVAKSVWIASSLIGLIFALRLVTGSGYRAQEFAAVGDVTRYLSYPETLPLIMGVTLALAFWVLELERHGRLKWSVVVLSLSALVIASNYRTSWLALAAGLLFAAGTLAIGKRGKAVMFLAWGAVGLGTTVMVLALTPFRVVMAAKLAPSNLLTTTTWRLFSWLHAWQVFAGHPVLGVGLGYKHVFLLPTENFESVALASRNDIHNDWLWILVNTGLVGALAAVAVAFGLILRALRHARDSSDRLRLALVCAAMGEVGALAVTATLQPTFSLGGTAVWLGVIAAIFAEPASVDATHSHGLNASHSSIAPQS